MTSWRTSSRGSLQPRTEPQEAVCSHSEGSLVLRHRGSLAVSSLRAGYPGCHVIRAILDVMSSERVSQPSRARTPRRRPSRRRVGESPAARAARIARRLAAVPKVTYPDDLPVAARRGDIAAAIRDNQVVIVAGETGSGKTTQLPKICLELGRGIEGLIGHTQPRRIAARSVAERIAEELNTELGT